MAEAGDHNSDDFPLGENAHALLAKSLDVTEKAIVAPLHVGQKVSAVSVESLGEGEGASDARKKEVIETLKGIAFSVGLTMGAKALLPVIFATIAPEFAAVGVPLIIAGITGYGIIKDAMILHRKLNACKEIHQKEDGCSGRQALVKAIKDNKFEAGAFCGSALMASFGFVGNFSDMTSAVLGESAPLGSATKLLTSLPSQIFATGEAIELTEDTVTAEADTMVLRERRDEEKELERVREKASAAAQGHDALVAKASLSGKSLADAPKGMKIHHAAKALHAKLKPVALTLASHTKQKLAAVVGKLRPRASSAPKQPAR